MTAVTSTDDWTFLNEWFAMLKGAVSVFQPSPDASDRDAVRLGRDDDELWINVRIVPTPAGLLPADALRTRYRALHRAIVLTSIVAVADHDAWRRALSELSTLTVPYAVDLDATTRRLQPQYRIPLASEGRELDWTDMKEIITGGDDHEDDDSARFQAHYTRAKETAARCGVDLDETTTFPVRVVDCPSPVARREQIARIRRTVDTIVLLQEREDSQASTRMTLRLASISATYFNYEFHSSVFREILALVETGVRVAYLSMPCQFVPCPATERVARHYAWALLVCALCGRPQWPTRRPVRVDKLVIDHLYVVPGMVIQFLSVLSEARSLMSLKVSALGFEEDPHSLFWAWLGSTLFRTDSACSVKMLTVTSIVLTTGAMESLQDVMATTDPIALLWEKTTRSGSLPHLSARHEILVPAGSTVRPFGDDPQTHVPSTELPTDWSGVVVDDDASKTTVGVLLYGIGFCEIDRASLPSKRRRVERPDALVSRRDQEARSPIQTLFLGIYRQRDEARNIIDEHAQRARADTLLGLLGIHLTSLSLDDSDVDEELLERCLAVCPHLVNLRLRCCQLSTMDPIRRLYERGSQISSLEVCAVTAGPSLLVHVDAFLQALLAPGPMKQTLKKLHIGRQWASVFRQSTADMLKQVLDDPLTLDYVHLYRCETRQVAPPSTWDVVRHHGEMIPVMGASPLATRVAFASVVKHLRTTNPRFARLDDAIVAPVLEFLGKMKKRVVISEVETYYNSRPYWSNIRIGT